MPRNKDSQGYDELIRVLERTPEIPFRLGISLLQYTNTSSKYRIIDSLEEQGRIVKFYKGKQAFLRLAYIPLKVPRKGTVIDGDYPLRLDHAMGLLRFTINLCKQHFNHPAKTDFMIGLRETLRALTPYVEAIQALQQMAELGATMQQLELMDDQLTKNGWGKEEYESFNMLVDAVALLGRVNKDSSYAGLPKGWWDELESYGSLKIEVPKGVRKIGINSKGEEEVFYDVE